MIRRFITGLPLVFEFHAAWAPFNQYAFTRRYIRFPRSVRFLFPLRFPVVIHRLAKVPLQLDAVHSLGQPEFVIILTMFHF